MPKPETRKSFYLSIKSGFVFALIFFLLFAVFSFQQINVKAQQTPDYQVTWEVENAPTGGRVGLILTIPKLKITNSGTETWKATGNEAYQVGYRWFMGYGALIDKGGANGFEEVRANLPQDIPSRGSVIFPDFKVGVPSQPGDYVLHIDLVQTGQNDTWLQSRGSKDLELKVTIKSRDTQAPTVTVNPLPLYTTQTAFQVSWAGKDEDGGSGIGSYDIQYKTANATEWTNWLTNTTLTASLFQGENGKTYQFRALARDQSGNTGKYNPDGDIFTRIDNLPPTGAVDTLPATSPETFPVRWSSFDNTGGANTGLFDVQYRDGDEGNWADWLSGTPGTAAVFKGEPDHTYSFRVRARDYAGNQADYPSSTQAKTRVSAALNTNDGIQPLTNAQATTLYFPLAVKNGDGGTGTSGLVVYNDSASPAEVAIHFYSSAGVPEAKTVNGQKNPVDNTEAVNIARLATINSTIPAKGNKTFWTGNLGLSSFNGWVDIESKTPVQASAVRMTTGGIIVRYSTALAAAKNYLPFVSRQGANNSSIITLANPNPQAATVEIVFYNEAGAPLYTEKRDIGRLASTRFSLADLKTPDPALRFNGSAIITASTPISVSVENTLADSSIVTYPGQPISDLVPLTQPVYKNVDGITTSAIIQNTGTAALQLKVEFLDEKNQVTESQDFDLAPFACQVVWQGSLKADSFKGKLRVSATGGNVAMVVIGAGLNGKAFP